MKPSNTNAHVTAQFLLKGKVAAVTGGVLGSGLSASRGLAEASATVATLYSSTKGTPKSRLNLLRKLVSL